MCFIQSGNTTIIGIPSLDPEAQKGMASLIGIVFLLQILAVIIVFFTFPIWLPFVFIQTFLENLLEQLSYDGWIIDPMTKFILISIGFILFSPVCCFVIIPVWVRSFNGCILLFRKVKIKVLRIFRQPITLSQKRQKFLIKKKILIWIWLLSLFCLPLIAFHTEVGFTKSDAELEQNVFDQLKLLELEKKYALNLKPEERLFMLDLTGIKSQESPSKFNGLTLSYDNHVIETNLGKRSSIILFYDEFERLQNKYHVNFAKDEKLQIIDLAENIVYEKIREKVTEAEILKYLEYSFISTIAEDRALKQITSFTSDELKLFGKFQPNKFWLPRFSRHRSIELTKLYKHDLSNEQRKVFYENYCNVVVNSIYRAYHVESGYLPGKNDSRMIKSEAKNPQGNPDFNDCRKFLLDKGYQLSNGAMFTYFYKP
ncbi:hypothetical protein [Microcystis aeruginosa]|uniref:hypothetical protein n=1 Tax=Microcystis aeruginosa TaxID=1126 RepID=UPI00232FD39E|nr:hypothetical protein [Microcystis aeruginosa]MDB9417014.1 hypothetical protein [Microcystis aeruginosa CS-556/03]